MTSKQFYIKPLPPPTDIQIYIYIAVWKTFEPLIYISIYKYIECIVGRVPQENVLPSQSNCG